MMMTSRSGLGRYWRRHCPSVDDTKSVSAAGPHAVLSAVFLGDTQYQKLSSLSPHPFVH